MRISAGVTLESGGPCKAIFALHDRTHDTLTPVWTYHIDGTQQLNAAPQTPECGQRGSLWAESYVDRSQPLHGSQATIPIGWTHQTGAQSAVSEASGRRLRAVSSSTASRKSC